MKLTAALTDADSTPAGVRIHLAAHTECNTRSCAVQEVSVLARAAKEQERRQGDKEGFTSSPGDCLAYKYHRDVCPEAPYSSRTMQFGGTIGSTSMQAPGRRCARLHAGGDT